MGCLAALPVLLLVGAISALAQDGVTVTQYQRPPASPLLPLNHDRLSRDPGLSPHVPEQVHLTLAGPGAMAVSWLTYPQVNKYVVRFGASPGQYTRATAGNNTCYEADDYVSGALHHVVLGAGPEGPLLPDTTYYYTCGDPELGMSPEFSFRTPPLTGPKSFPYRLGLIGDLGQTENSAQTLDHLTASNPDSVINVGDLSYADGYQPRWDTYGRLVAPHTSRFAWAVIEGNHELEVPKILRGQVANGKPGFLAYETRYWFPSKESRSYSPFYYSYEVAGAHVVMLGCYVEYGEESEQYEWLVQDLAGVDRGRTPWVIVGMHAPWYNSNQAHQHEVDDMMEAMEEVLFQNGVDAVFAGHVHAYERFHRTYKGERHECGPAYIVIGDGGNREGLAETYDDPQPGHSAYREASYGHGVFELKNATHALWQWHRNQDAQPVISDEVRPFFAIFMTIVCVAAMWS
ncbi:Metallo-dependent phosphatase [Coccomyxa subellipsoidea C-169]|uniref:Purple acid phosphatase n=1 Tax=Coccomyxa subellipsoidea (strain C-169) TaxID=574566 RepID=I0Z8X7_COCSC|nr:Metallo-dependent phosphatase [Coccomyxa subellipsoidea C-169]EIE27096.1 Metallo-dependent phosphatase [Coccomyxa subellipsoidea C-169]|eukprot:XP_005651640.1 Metallo-dependent phosphatase [Coccomyxa subellipsoidea C-169]